MPSATLNPILVHKGRTTTVIVKLNFDASGDSFASEIRSGIDPSSTLIATWNVSFVNDGSDGVLRLTLDNLVTAAITYKNGYMDLKRIVDGEPMSVFDGPIPVTFERTVTQ